MDITGFLLSSFQLATLPHEEHPSFDSVYLDWLFALGRDSTEFLFALGGTWF